MRTVLTILTLAALCTGSGETQRQKLADRPPDLSLTAVGRQHPLKLKKHRQ
jgi:hypothetical protein